MESFFVRYRNPLVLLAILVAQIIGLAVQVRQTGSGRNTLDSPDSSEVRLIRLWADMLVSPPERLIHSSKLGVGYLWQNYLDLRHVREQNQDLQKTIDRLRLEQASLLEDAHQGQRLQALLGFQQKYIYTTLAAQAIGSSGSDQSRVFYLDKGSADGLERDMAVITADGIVGKVRDVFPHSAQVLAINDQTSGAGVILETTRVRGVLRGNAAGQPEIVDIMSDQRIQPGEKVLTAGGDQIFPRGLPVGVVEKVVRDPDRDSFIDVIVKPAAQLDRLDEVLVITSTQPRFSPQDQQDIATSESLKGAEAAAIQAQQKASQIMAERLPGLTDPNLPPDQQPLLDTSNPNPVAHPPLALHPDRFTPGAATAPAPDADAGSTPGAAHGLPREKQTSAPEDRNGSAAPKVAPKANLKPGSKPSLKSGQPTQPAQTKPQRNP
ncbi:MAG: rod shape-determining protein MreC [Terracidiphilus sp.]|nr:rod shape-determining protein MreC [Terracidiphilus sp.]